MDGCDWVKSAANAVTKVAEVVSWVPGPIGAVASGVAAVGNAVQGAGEGVPNLVFEDEQGHFEDWAQPDQVIDYIRRRITAAKS